MCHGYAHICVFFALCAFATTHRCFGFFASSKTPQRTPPAFASLFIQEVLGHFPGRCSLEFPRHVSTQTTSAYGKPWEQGSWICKRKHGNRVVQTRGTCSVSNFQRFAQRVCATAGTRGDVGQFSIGSITECGALFILLSLKAIEWCVLQV